MSEKQRSNKRKISTPSEGYVCSICNNPGHWVQQCPDRRRKKSNSNHVYIPGVDPSEKDIETARNLQKIKPPNCFCGIASRLKKVKRSHASDNSRAVGKYFFFCSKKKEDMSKCKFARPVENETKPKNDIICTFYAKRGFCMRGERCLFKHEEIPNKTNLSHSNEQKKLFAVRKFDEDNKKHNNGNIKDKNKTSDSSSSSDSSSDNNSISDDDSASDGVNKDHDQSPHNTSSRNSSSDDGSSSDDESRSSDEGSSDDSSTGDSSSK